MFHEKGILVGVDGSDSAFNALNWAVAEAKVRGLGVYIACAYSLPRFGGSSMDAAYVELGKNAVREGAEAVLNDALKHAEDLGAEVQGSVEVGDPAGVLVELSKQAALAVVGTRGRGGFAERLLGTVSTALPVHAHCPTVVVPGHYTGVRANDDGVTLEHGLPVASPHHIGQIVVGVDGSDASKVALHRAVDEAVAWGAHLTAFSSMPVATGTSLFAWAPGQIDHTAVLAELEAEVGHAVDEELSGRSDLPEDFQVELHGLDGTPSALLVEFSSQVDLIVVGSRGRGGFSGLLLGSTSQAVLHHARCPVMVVPARLKDGPACGGCDQEAAAAKAE
ncbi:MAG: universal stress protein [Bifidobacteriaceae bacterium]|jgi:nucleotide-binding universal stress UspA family protein|nr:universal stress protein [Bifidobacteriaceae bacterium]